MKKETIELMRQMIPVLLGVLAALFISEWREDLKTKTYLKSIQSSITLELAESISSIEETIPKQSTLVDSLTFYSHTEQESVIDILEKVDGLHVPNIKTNSWEVISRSGIELLDYRFLKVLSDIRSGQDFLRDKEEFLLSYIFNNLSNTSLSAKETIRMIVLDMINTELTIKEGIVEFQKLNSEDFIL